MLHRRLKPVRVCNVFLLVQPDNTQSAAVRVGGLDAAQPLASASGEAVAASDVEMPKLCERSRPAGGDQDGGGVGERSAVGHVKRAQATSAWQESLKERVSDSAVARAQEEGVQPRAAAGPRAAQQL